MSNRLQHETSPYLLQHQHNPVDWYPWGDDALTKANSEDKLLLISIGYSSCHWCHVMAHESFEDDAIAAMMNEWFVCIKVDREERPDIDSIYMGAVQAMSGHGGWPLNVFATPDGTPVFGGTYWPPEDRGNHPGFPRVLRTLHRAWNADRDNLLASADKLRELLQNSNAALPQGSLTETSTDQALTNLVSQFDQANGGFGSAPKFPQASVLDFLFRHGALTREDQAQDMALRSLRSMAAGGIHDQIGGGFSRYSVDAEWLVPHFEKMLYDNAQLLSLYVIAYKLTGDSIFLETANGIVGWANRELKLESGAFCAALDADSEGVEGKFYVWSNEEIDSILTPEAADLVRLHFGVTPEGNFEHGTSILHVARSLDELASTGGMTIETVREIIADAREQLLNGRSQRVPPGRDDKVITSWNALMITAFCQYADVQGEEAVNSAVACGEFLFQHLMTEDGHLRHSWNRQQTRGDGVLEDYALLIEACVELYRVTAQSLWLDRAMKLHEIVRKEFAHESGIGFYDTGIRHEVLVTRPRELQDTATPSGNAVVADVLVIVAALQQEPALERQAQSMLEGLAKAMEAYPSSFGRSLAAASRIRAGTRELVFAGDLPSLQSLRSAAFRKYLPNVVVGYADPNTPVSLPMVQERPTAGSGAAWLCENQTCLPPVTTAEDLEALLNQT